MVLIFFVYLACVILFFVDLFLVFKFIEYVYCADIRKQPPMVSSNKMLRQLVLQQIKNYYKDAKNICEIGSGYGGLSRYIAKNTKAKVYGIENMPFSAFLSKILNLFCFGKCKTVWGDAFKYLDDVDIIFDVGIVYLGPKLTPLLIKYKKKILVLISLDFEITDLNPTRVIDLGYGATVYKKQKYPHRIFVYEF